MLTATNSKKRDNRDAQFIVMKRTRSISWLPFIVARDEKASLMLLELSLRELHLTLSSVQFGIQFFSESLPLLMMSFKLNLVRADDKFSTQP